MRTIVSSFGLPVIDKFETCTSIEEFHEPNNSRYVYEMSEIPMSWFSAKLASELATIFEAQGPQMVSQVLGNFSILYIIKNMRTDETLLVVAFVVECCERNQDPGSVFYRLVL
uniref:YAP binding domain-containing protein n=1 Tax=Acrobeloides nanus TaxID=290746 RepID=A0A914C8S8_9BILA